MPLTDTLTVKDEGTTVHPRCHLEFTLAVRLRDTAMRDIPDNRRVPHVAEYLALAVHCTLSGPFDDLFLARLSAPRALCTGIIAVISASTV